MTVLEALATLESAVLECKQRDIDTPEIRAAVRPAKSSLILSWKPEKRSTTFREEDQQIFFGMHKWYLAG
jgi:hypothetical protein